VLSDSALCPLCGRERCDDDYLAGKQGCDPTGDELLNEPVFVCPTDVYEHGKRIHHAGKTITLAEAVRLRLTGAVAEVTRKPMHSAEDRQALQGSDRDAG
jgi:hypothetical protein